MSTFEGKVPLSEFIAAVRLVGGRALFYPQNKDTVLYASWPNGREDLRDLVLVVVSAYHISFAPSRYGIWFLRHDVDAYFIVDVATDLYANPVPYPWATGNGKAADV